MLYPIITEKKLRSLYLDQNMSMMQISRHLGCSQRKIAYWMSEYRIERRTHSQATYLTHNPTGDPFKIILPVTSNELILFGLGIGLYWGEGSKSNKNAVRLGNTDPGIIKCFVKFLTDLCGVNVDSLKFGLQIFSDLDPSLCLKYWVNQLGLPESQFYKPVITKSGSIGTYRVKNKYGVVTIYFGNTKLRNIIAGQIAEAASLFGKTGRRSLVVKHTHGKRESTSSILVVGSINQKNKIVA